MDLPTTLMAPIVEIVDGIGPVTFPLLRVADLALIAQDIKAEQLAACERQLDASHRITKAKDPTAEGITAVQRYRARMEIEVEEFSTHKIIDRIKTPTGSSRVLEISLRNHRITPDMTDEQRAAAQAGIEQVLDVLDLIETSNLALRVSRIVKPKKPDAANGSGKPGDQKPDVRPLDLPPDRQSETGSPIPPPSAPPDSSPTT